MSRFVTLEELRGVPELEYMPLLRRGQRLSVQPVNADEWARILALAGVTADPGPGG